MYYNNYKRILAIRIVHNMVNHGFNLEGLTARQYAEKWDYNIGLLSVKERVFIMGQAKIFQDMPATEGR